MYTNKHPLSTALGLPIYRELTLEEIDVYINPNPDNFERISDMHIEGISEPPHGRSRGE